MITTKAILLSNVAIGFLNTHSPGDLEGFCLSDAVWDELYDNCAPTEAEFVRLTHGILYTSHVIYRLWNGRKSLG